MRSTRNMTVYQFYRTPDKCTSQIRLQGDWLSSAGFSPGTKITVQVEEGRLVIGKNN